MTANRPIPFVDLATPHVELQEELVAAFTTHIRSAAFIGGPAVEGFERDFAAFCDAKHCVGVSSGTDALRFALTGAGVQPGDIVLTVPHTFIATTEAISQAGALPDFIDIDAKTYTIDPSLLRQYMESKCVLDVSTGRYVHRTLGKPVAAVVPVHLYGQTADMDPILEVAERFGLAVIEDACQAHGAEYFSKKQNRWLKAGSMGRAAAFSFYPGKNLGACGEGGAITTNDEKVARQAKILRDHGQSQKYHHEIEGYNGRLDAIQAAILSVKLPHLAEWNQLRQDAARRYDAMLSSFEDIVIPCQPEWARSVYHLYVIRVFDREGLQKYLADAKIYTGIHYPVALHLQRAYKHLGYKQGDFPVSEKAASEILSLPMYPQLEPRDQTRVVQTIWEFLSQSLSLRESSGFELRESQL
jgi:dTDP-4-amino-4,6-dideoxygalactose transaminase